MKVVSASRWISIVILSLGFALCPVAHAGFVTGMVAGALMASDGHKPKVNDKAQEDGQDSEATALGVLAISSDHDLIFCRTDVQFHPGLCREHGVFFDDWVAPAAFAKEQGFRTVISQGVAATGEVEYILIMVSRH